MTREMLISRRLSGRLRFDELEPPRLRFSLGGKEIDAAVLDLSKEGLRVHLEGAQADALKVGTLIETCILVMPWGLERPDCLLTVLEVVDNPEGGLILRLRSDDSATRAALWSTMEAYRTGRIEPHRMPEILAKSSIPQVPARGIYTEKSRLERLAYVRDETGLGLDNLHETSLRAEKLTGNIENFIGGVEVPVGLAGPLLFHGLKAKGFIYAPFATTEGALVASATRGATAISRSGGVTTRAVSQRMMRVPLFVLSDMEGAFLFSSWIRDHENEIQQEIRKVSRHANLISATPHLLGSMVHVTFLYETGDAAGQNMTTTCTWHVCQWLMNQMKYFETIKFENFIIEANMSGDKKVNYHSFIEGRGTRVTAECFIHEKIMVEVLKVTPEQLIKTNQGVMAGSLQVGMVGYNINIANVLAAIFAATGQDIACVHESSIGQLHLQLINEGVYGSMLLPSLIVGTVGGGTHLPRQNELLQLMDCAGPGKVSRLAEIIAGYCLALDLSTLSAVAGGQFASAHERLGRSRPVNWFGSEDLNTKFFLPGLKAVLKDEEAKLLKVSPVEDVELGSSIISELTARKVRKLVGLLPYRLDYLSRDSEGSAEVIVKVKPLDAEVILMVNTMAAMCGRTLASEYSAFKDRTGFEGCHTRELGIYRQGDSRFTGHMPVLYEAYQNDEREAYVLVLERLQDVVLMDTAADTSGWGRAEIEAALQGAAEFHSVWYGREDELLKQPWLGRVQSLESMIEMVPLWEALGVHASEEFPEWVSQEDLALHRRLVRRIPDWWARIERMPRTLIHNDFNPRNICFRKDAGGLRLCAYDWELATLQLPQHDLVELLAFVLSPETPMDELAYYVEFHRKALVQAVGREIDPSMWHAGYRVSLLDFTVNRAALYIMAHTFRHYAFMERVVRTLRHLIRLETDQ